MFLTLLCMTHVLFSCNSSKIKTIYKENSQGSNLWTQYYKYYEKKNDFNIRFNTTYQFHHSLNGKHIARSLFNNHNILFQGINFQNEDRNNDALIAEYFGMGPDTNVSLSLDPSIINNILDVQINGNGEHVWFCCNIPFVYSIRTLVDNYDKKINGSIGQQPLQNNAIATLFTPPLTQGGPLQWLNPGINSNALLNYKAGTSININNTTISNQNDGPILDDVASLDTSSGFSDIAFYLFQDSSQSIQDNEARSNITTPCANLDSDFNIKFNGGNENDYPLINEEIGIGFFESCFLNTSSGLYDGTSGEFIVNNINGNTLNSTWQNVCDDYNLGLEIVQPQINSAKNIDEALSGYTFGDFQKRSYHKWKFNKKNSALSDFGIADIQMSMGWNTYNKNNKRCGLYTKIVLPTGTKINEQYWHYTFNPIIGNGNHFELGAGINGYVQLYESEDTLFRCSFDGYANHSFGSRQFRSCDDLNKPLSRYALVKELTYNQLVSDLSNEDMYLYNNVLRSLGDINAHYIDVAIDIRGEGVIDFEYLYKRWGFGLGYNFIGQTEESMTDCKKSLFDESKWYGYHMLGCITSIRFTANGNVTTPESKIACFAKNTDNRAGTYIQAKTNGQIAEKINTDAYRYGTSKQATDENVFQCKTLNNSCLVESYQLHKIFIHIDYHYNETSHNPLISILGSLSFKNNHKETYASQWTIGGRFGFTF